MSISFVSKTGLTDLVSRDRQGKRRVEASSRQASVKPVHKEKEDPWNRGKKIDGRSTLTKRSCTRLKEKGKDGTSNGKNALKGGDRKSPAVKIECGSSQCPRSRFPGKKGGGGKKKKEKEKKKKKKEKRRKKKGRKKKEEKKKEKIEKS